MISANDIIINENTTILKTLEIIDKSSKKIALVTDKNKKLLGTISDGDIRRALLKNIPLNSTIKNIYNKKPITAKLSDDKNKIISLCTKYKIHQIPIVNDDGILQGIEIIEDLLTTKKYPNKVVLMVGGLGTRLRPLTEKIPKPMLNIGNKPILQTIMENFIKEGFNNFILCLGYKGDIIKNYFKDGSKFNANIEYIIEDKRMGTAGALSLLKQKPKEPFFVMNGDILTNVNFKHMLDFHTQNKAIATMAVRTYEIEVPFGVVNIKNEIITSIEEKPIHKFFVNAGIYILQPECLDYIPKNQFYDMPNLFEKLIKENKKTISFPLREYWLDIGRIDEFQKAQIEYFKVFDE
jgi:dTDP-glucose pyrophosphorylase